MAVYGNMLESTEAKNTYRGRSIILNNTATDYNLEKLKEAISILYKNNISIEKDAKQTYFSLAESRGCFDKKLEQEERMEERRRSRGVYEYNKFSIRERFHCTLATNIEALVNGSTVTFKLVYRSRDCRDYDYEQTIEVRVESKIIKFSGKLI